MRDRLASSGALFGSYHPEMDAVHIANAGLLQYIVATAGWPDEAAVGRAAADAAWLIAQHAIGLPDFQRACLRALQASTAEPWRAAMLADRIAVNEGRPQCYGTQFDWDEGGLSPEPIDDPVGVEARRAAIGLESLDVAARQLREGSGPPPADLSAYRAEQDAWRRATGWIAD